MGAALLLGHEWHKGGSSAKMIPDAAGKKYFVECMSLDVTPRLTLPSQGLEVSVELDGEKQLENADLSNLKMELFSPEAVIASVSTENAVNTAPTADECNNAGSASIMTAKVTRRIKGRFHAPDKEGAYGIRLVIPEQESLETFFAVLEP